MGQPPRSPAPSAPRPERIEYTSNRRLARVRNLSRLLDTVFELPGGFRIGLDPIIGLVPGIGDLIGSVLSLWIIYDAARLGLAKRVLLRMGLNVAIEAIIGAVPVLGDLIDAAWKANVRNMRLVEAHYTPALRERSFRKLLLVVAALLLLGAASTVLLVYWIITFGILQPLRDLF